MYKALLTLFVALSGVLSLGSSYGYATETLPEEAIRRVPPVLHSLTMPEKLIAGESYTIRWSLVGYENNYSTMIVFFDCTGVAPPNCGNAYNDPKLAVSSKLTSSSMDIGEWSYLGTASSKLDYSYTFTPDVTADTKTVIRFYYINGSDNNNGRPTISLMAPGSLANVLPYDVSGRRLTTTIFAANSLSPGAPTISTITAATVLPGGAISKQLTVVDVESASNDLIISATSSNQALVPDDQVFIRGTGITRNLTMIPIAGQTGESTITVMVRDSDGQESSGQFSVNVAP